MKNLTIDVGDYVRTKYGIAKVIDLKENPYGEKTIYVLDNKIISMCECEEGILYSAINPLAEDLIDKFDINFGDESQIIKSSPNIIDLIEVGDYVNGDRIDSIETTDKGIKIIGHEAAYSDSNFYYWNDDIETIVTKEMYSSVEYRVENN